MGLLRATVTVSLLAVFFVKQQVWDSAPAPAPPPLAAADFSNSTLVTSPPTLYRFLFEERDLNDTCGQTVQKRFKCTAPGCEDLVPGESQFAVLSRAPAL